MTKHRINTVSKDCWWTPHIYSGFWASFNVSFCLDDHFVSRTWITDKLAGIFPHFLQVSALFWSNVFPVKLCKPSNICWPSRPWILRKKSVLHVIMDNYPEELLEPVSKCSHCFLWHCFAQLPKPTLRYNSGVSAALKGCSRILLACQHVTCFRQSSLKHIQYFSTMYTDLNELHGR